MKDKAKVVLTDEQNLLLKEIREMEAELREHEMECEDLQSLDEPYDADDEKCEADSCAFSLIELVRRSLNMGMANHPTIKRLTNEFHDNIFPPHIGGGCH